MRTGPVLTNPLPLSEPAVVVPFCPGLRRPPVPPVDPLVEVEIGEWVYTLPASEQREIDALVGKLQELCYLRPAVGRFISRLVDDLLADGEGGGGGHG